MDDSRIREGTSTELDADLDREHRNRVRRVATNDTRAGQDEDARHEDGRLVEETQELAARREGLGGEEHVEACRRCRWLPYAVRLWRGSRLAMFLDSLLWAILWGSLWWLWVHFYKVTTGTVPAWLTASVILVPFLALASARLAKGLGQHVGVARLTNPKSVSDTVDRQVAFAGATAVAAGVFLLLILALLFFAPASWSSWSTYVSGLLGFCANIALGLSAGVGGHAAELLMKPAERDDIDCQIAMKDRTRRLLRQYFVTPVLVLAVIGSVRGAVVTADSRASVERRQDVVLVEAVDVTDSGDPEQRELGISAMIDRAPERARSLGAQAIVVVTFSDELLLSNMTWLPVPQRPTVENCDRVSPEFRATKSAMILSPVGLMKEKNDAVHACVVRRDAAEAALGDQDRRMREQLRQAMRVPPRRDGSTRIVPLLKTLTTRPYVRAIEVLTDGIDNSGIPLSALTVPDRMHVTVILLRPNPRRRSPSVDDVLAASDAWGRVRGVTVTSVSEYAGFSQFVEVR